MALSPRTAVLLAGLVVLVAGVVVAVGSWSGTSSSAGGGGDGQLSVAGAPSAVPSRSPAGGPPSSSAAPLVVVHVVGAVARPGIVTLPGGSRVSDAVERAGSARDDADLARLNLARVLVDGERLYVPKVGETDIPAALDGSSGSVGGGGAGSDGAGGGAGSAVDTVVDLNTADQTLLETLPGIGPSLAGRILAWRDEHGRFAAVEDLLDVSGIGDARFAELRDRVRV
ncbi:hypothetical protein BIV01_08750 [Curtobacterium sp. MCBA15_013]|nr:hypothetical protein BIV01_08750 [Curtobacterium sp. MCBA15_013]